MESHKFSKEQPVFYYDQLIKDIGTHLGVGDGLIGRLFIHQIYRHKIRDLRKHAWNVEMRPGEAHITSSIGKHYRIAIEYGMPVIKR